MHDLQRHLEERFVAASAQALDFTIAVTCPAGSLVCRITDGTLTVAQTAAVETVDFTIYVPSEDRALALWRGELAPMDAFMAGELRASGYIVDVFRFLGAFRPGAP